ncbi:molybdopterin molybdotransferase MoeA [Desulfohalobiaceae bacterium Ax17]|uniref:molybdopterin molybdotransferase MoeA n=1 Tax=Desulfovulcanus ferrireducens TaxID=2831190 RepID=UPI003369F04A|nr:molybdopterin molybdotransferase MoeA [Desulfovulcanus ferrireducens]
MVELHFVHQLLSITHRPLTKIELEDLPMQDFFQVISVKEFISKLKDFSPVGTVELPLTQAFGRVLAQDIVAREDLPLVHRSCMDGYALMAKDSFGASESNPAYLEVVGEVEIEKIPDFTLGPGQCARIVTGGTLPDGADSVIMIEHTQDLGAGTIEIRKSVAPHENVMLKGEDFQVHDLALSSGTCIDFKQVGILAALGVASVRVYQRVKVGIISTGDELVPVHKVPEPGQVRDVNSYTLAQLVDKAGGEFKLYGIVQDELQDITSALETATQENDVVLISGGSSIGTRDLTVQALESIKGVEILAHGVAISPGKPTILARKENKAIWGLPGQVASAQVVMLVLTLPFMRHLAGQKNAFAAEDRVHVQAELARNIASKYGREDYVRVKLDNTDGKLKAIPILGKSGLLKTIVQADGLLKIPDNLEGLEKGTEVLVWKI